MMHGSTNPTPTLPCPAQTLAQLASLLALKTRRDVLSALGGTLPSPARGQGMDFNELREYQPGDDARHILWQSAAAHGSIKYKQYHEEHDIADLVAVDVSHSMTVSQDKWSLTVQTAAVPCAVSTLFGNGASLITFAEHTESITRLTTGTHALALAIRLLLAPPDTAPPHRTNLPACLDAIDGTLKKPTRIFLVSDLAADGYLHSLARLASRHDLTVCHIAPSILHELPDGETDFEDAETRRRFALSPLDRNAIRNNEKTWLAETRRAINAAKANYLLFDGARPPVGVFQDSLHFAFHEL